LVDDVVQEVFLAALKGLAAFEGQSSLRTWLVAIARHKIEDIYRQRLRAALPLDVDSTEDEPIANEIPLDEQTTSPIDSARITTKRRRSRFDGTCAAKSALPEGGYGAGG
jgi:RNA polymerase sigma factor (sigma-70 family)